MLAACSAKTTDGQVFDPVAPFAYVCVGAFYSCGVVLPDDSPANIQIGPDTGAVDPDGALWIKSSAYPARP
jgi:hypothetical protein